MDVFHTNVLMKGLIKAFLQHNFVSYSFSAAFLISVSVCVCCQKQKMSYYVTFIKVKNAIRIMAAHMA